MSFDRLAACLTRIDAEYKAPELAQTSKKHSFSEFAERVLFVYLALAMLDRCIPVAPRLFPRQKQSEVHTMHDRKSLYSRNKRNSRAILCPDAFEQDHPLTPEQFSSEEEFRFWKMWSDENYHGWELADHIYSDHTSPLTEYSAAEPSPEETILARLDRRESVMFAQSSLQKIRGIVTEKQYRRIQMYCEGMTYREIAEAEGVSAKNVFKSVVAGKKKISKILEKGGNK